MMNLIQISPEKIQALKKNLVWYLLMSLSGVIIYQNRNIGNLNSDKEKLYERMAIKDSIIHYKDQEVISYYQNFFVETSKLLVMQKMQINKADTIINKLSNGSVPGY